MRYLIPLLLITLPLVTACKKKNLNFSMKGIVMDTSFNQGLSGATIELYEIGTDGTISNSPVGTTTVGSDGSYELTFPRNKVLSYNLSIRKELYFEINDKFSFDDFNTESAIIKNYSSSAKSWVRLVFINQSPADASDMLHFNKQAGKSGCAECCSADEYTVSGTAPYELICVNDGNTTYSYLQTNNQSPPSIESITTIPFDTVDLIKLW